MQVLSTVAGAEIGEMDFEFRLRAERSGGGNGRVYTATYRALDASGNAEAGEARVIVPHDRRRLRVRR